MTARTLSVVVPTFNEEQRLARTIEAVRSYSSRCGRTVELIVVDDGSVDGTLQIAALNTPGVLLLRGAQNRGKGAAVRRGMLEAGGDVILMCDADLASPIEEIEKLLPWVDQGYDIIIGSRDLPASTLDPPQPLARRLAAWTFRAIRRRLMLPNIRDTQCGFKLFTRRAARDVFSRATVDGWLFDCEALGIAEKLGYRIREVGVVWRNDPDSRVRMLPTALRTIPELLAIRRRLQHM